MNINLSKCPAYLVDDDPDRVLFKYDNDPLSNYFGCDIKLQGAVFISSEQAYQWMKTISLGHSDLADKIQNAATPREFRRITQNLNNRDLENWELSKLSTMEHILRAKFESCSQFREAWLQHIHQ